MKPPSNIHIEPEIARRYRILPIREDQRRLVLGVSEKPDHATIQEISFLLGREILLESHYSAQQITEGLASIYGDESLDGKTGDHNFQEFALEETSGVSPPAAETPRDDGSVIRLVNRFLNEAIRLKASDIHIEHFERLCRVRFRIDGKLIQHQEISLQQRQPVISRLKIMANLDIAEKRRPQDGRIRLKNERQGIDIRVSTMPTDFGEKVVLRILDKSAIQHDIHKLGISDPLLAKLKLTLGSPYGMILVTGPTGSGKTTTLYSALNYVNRNDVNIITIEDPIEYHLEGINQTMVHTRIDLTFARLLRTILRQDPNIIMVGEVRDPETAEVAVQAALTGHLVLTTLHTNDAISTIVRLLDLDIEPFLICSAVKMILAQRLLRRICPDCKTTAAPQEHYFDYSQLTVPRKQTYYHGSGCKSCHQTGYRGREAVIEYLTIDDEFAELILRKASLSEFRALASKKNLKSLPQLALEKAIAGTTTLDEVFRETVL